MIKKVLVSLCVLPLLLTACSKDEVIAPVADSGKAIGFGTVLAPASRGAVVDKDALQDPDYGFSVSAYNQGTATTWANYLTAGLPATGPNFMNNTPVTWSNTNTAWEYDPVKYWPGIVSGGGYGHVTFFGLGGLDNDDLDEAFTYNATSHAPEFVHTTQDAAADQKDLVADVQFDRYWGHAEGNPVKFQFKHILSKIGFTAKLAGTYTGATIKVTSLKVVYATDKVKSKGTYAFNTNATTANDGWTLATPASYLTGESGELVNQTNGVEVNSTSPVPLNEAGKFLMLIPQDVAAGDLTVVFTYTVTQGSMPAETYPNVTYSIPAIEYKKGKQYTYNFTFTLNKVEFVLDEADIDWGEPDSGNKPADIPVQ
jgi:hypothetical protein